MNTQPGQTEGDVRVLAAQVDGIAQRIVQPVDCEDRITLERAADVLRGFVPERVVTTPHDDPIVAACVEHGGHFWPEDAPEDEPPTCTRCWFNPGWQSGKPRNEHELRPIVDRPEA